MAKAAAPEDTDSYPAQQANATPEAMASAVAFFSLPRVIGSPRWLHAHLRAHTIVLELLVLLTPKPDVRKKRQRYHRIESGSLPKCRIPHLDAGRNPTILNSMNVTLPLKEMTIAEKIGIMEEIWSDLSNSGKGYSTPAWHDRILEERARLAESGKVGFTDWDTAKKQINDRVS